MGIVNGHRSRDASEDRGEEAGARCHRVRSCRFSVERDPKTNLTGLRHRVLDLGSHSTAPVDYPDFAEAVGLAVRQGDAERGIMICGSSVGGSIAANKIPKIRAGLCHDAYSAREGVEHDDMNVLVMGGRVIGGGSGA